MERCAVNFVLLCMIFICLALLYGRWRGELDKFYEKAWEEELKSRNDGSYERYLEAKNKDDNNS